PTITIIDHTFLCKWPNLRNRQGFKYLFSPLYIQYIVYIYICIHTGIFTFYNQSQNWNHYCVALLLLKLEMFLSVIVPLLFFSLSLPFWGCAGDCGTGPHL